MKRKPQAGCLIAISIALIVGLVACGDDTEPQKDTGPTPDQFVYLDTQVQEDSFVIPDAGPDTLSPDTLSPDLPPPVEGGVDMAGDAMVVVDSGTDATGDAMVVVPTNDTCANAEPMTFSGTKATATGDTTTATDTVDLSSSSCIADTSGGPDLFYEISLTGGKTYVVTLTPDSGFDPSLYAFTDCTQPEATCVAGIETISTGGEEKITISPTTSGTYYIAVDTWYSSSSGQGTFTLTVEELPKPTNDTCSSTTVKGLTFASGKISEAGYTAGATNSVDLLASDCTGNTTTGSDVFYSVPLTVGNTYMFKLDGDGFNEALYLFSDCANVSGTCSTGMGADANTTSAEEIVFSPTSTGDYYIGVDGRAATDAGFFTLTVDEYVKPTNDICGTGTIPISLVNRKALVTGHIFGATDTVNLTATDCTGDTTAGPDVFYSIQLTAGSAYMFELDGDGFNESLYIFTDCANVSGTCGTDMGMDDWSSLSEELVFAPATTGTYYIGVDGRDADEYGTFTLSVEEYTQPAGDTCTAAPALTFVNGVATEKGHLHSATDTVNLTAADCTGDTSAGPDVFYSIQMTAGNSYKFNLDGDGFNEVLYLFSTCSNAAGTCAAGVDDYSTSSEDLVYTPTQSGTYYLAVDSRNANEAGIYTLTAYEFAMPTNLPTFTAPFSFNFDGDCKGLATTLDWECGNINFTAGTGCDSDATPPTAGHSGTGMWGTKLDDCYTPYGNNSDYSACTNDVSVDDSILAFKVTLPSGWTTATMTYWSWDDLYTPYDWSEIRVNGTLVAGTPTCSGSYSKPTAWVQKSVDLSSYVGQTVDISFHSMASTGTNYAGWYIDDLAVSGS